MTDLHFDKKNLWEDTNVRGDKTYLTIFSIIAVLIMFIACINYMNLATARSVKRGKEVGLRKTFGSNRSGIAKQFFLESFLMILASLLLAVLLDILLLHPFNQLAHKTFTIGSLINPVHDSDRCRHYTIHGIYFRSLPGILFISIPTGGSFERASCKRQRRRVLSKEFGHCSVYCCIGADHLHIHRDKANGAIKNHQTK